MRRSLLIVIIGGGITAIVLATGAANPPRAGSHIVKVSTKRFTLPPPPYTLEIAVNDDTPTVATFKARWGVQFMTADLSHINFWLYTDGYFAMPPLVPNSTAFIHIKPTNNQFYLDVQADGGATLRLNHEIAWQGRLPLSLQAEFMPERAIMLPNITLYEP